MAKNSVQINYDVVNGVVKFLPETIGEREGITVNDFFHEVNGKREVYFKLVEKKLERIILKAVTKYVISEGYEEDEKDTIANNLAIMYEIAKVARIRMVVG